MDTEEDMFRVGIAFASSLACVSDAASLVVRDFRDRAGKRKLIRRPFSIVQVSLDDSEFKTAFRMTRKNFHRLCNLLKDPLTRNEKQGSRSCAGVIDVETRVVVFIHTLAGAQYIDVMLTLCILRSIVYKCIREVVEAVLLHLPLPDLPRTEQERIAVSNGFTMSRISPSPLRGCCGAIDSIAIEICKLSVHDAASYWNRKGYHSLPV